MLDQLISELLRIDVAIANFYFVYLLACLIIGIAMGLFGLKLFYIWMGLIGFAFGTIIALIFGADFVVASAVGVAFGLCNIFLYVIGIAFVGIMCGLAVAAVIPESNVFLFLGLGLFGMVLALFISNLVVAISSSFFGAGLITFFVFSVTSPLFGNASGVITAGNFVIHAIDNFASHGAEEALLVTSAYLYLWVALTVVCVFFQMFRFNKSNRGKEKKIYDKELQSLERKREFWVKRKVKYPRLVNFIYKRAPHLNPDEPLSTTKERQQMERKKEMGEIKESFRTAFSKNKEKS